MFWLALTVVVGAKAAGKELIQCVRIVFFYHVGELPVIMMLLEGLTNSHENGPQTTCVHLGLRGAQNNAGFTSGHYEKNWGVKSKVWCSIWQDQ